MNKNKNEGKTQISLSELQQIIKEELSKISEGSFDKKVDRIKKDWGGEIESDDEFDAMEFFGDAGDAAEADIRAEFGDDEFASFGSMEDPRMLKDLEEATDERGLFQVEDSEGNIIKKLALVTPVSGIGKKGRVTGFGDDGGGRLQLLVTWEWPTDMKFTNPEEMGKDRVYPEDVIIADSKPMKESDGGYGGDKLRAVKVTYGDGNVISTSVAAHLTDEEIYDYFKVGKMFNIGSLDDNLQPVADVEIIRENLNTNIMNEELEEEINEEICDTDTSEGDEETIEEMRGLGAGVKNSGDRNVKLRDDNSHAPLTNLNESVNKSIKGLLESKITKKQLKQFISEEAKKVAKSLRG